MPTPEPVEDDVADFTAVIPAGGMGTRLWPLSRASSPKFLQDLTGTGQSLLQATSERLATLVGDRIIVVTGARHEDSVRRQLPQLSADNFLVEPAPRDSMPAIGLAAAVLERRDPEAVLGSFAADHLISDLDVFGDCVRQAVVAARQGSLVTLGITPTYPSTAFGYIKVGDPRRVPGAPGLRHVDAFVEKPDAARATTYLDSGQYLWNAGMFIVKATVLLDLLATQHPKMVQVLRAIAAAPERLSELWGSLAKISIDHAVAEPAAAAGFLVVVPASFAWDDVGDFASLSTILSESAEQPGLRILGDPALVVNRGATGVVAAGSGRTVVTLGVRDIVVIDTPDALLVTTREHCQDVKQVVETLQSVGREDLT
ncbi:MAG: sugar phosphate nucleotidyltransferase [Ornithinimicrobium sp.]|uniref:mannose-1-phosphate guanylyltransferase n=1 Tax=Ornithinimicrobium sp. TaxID=1977084 RepID=UPI0026E040EE|nr:sugar phosphate nucleotidyltransferase [Ornithinimicrobium sp.]MDO5738836.1 sugar phosphate nucleotidyltransferase [Ornithinimicrobium sp.]